MYEKYSRQALPDKSYRELLGSALCVFNSNNAFIIENILHNDVEGKYNWYTLIDTMSGSLKLQIKETITCKFGDEIENLFSKLVDMRNRIIHSFQVTIDDQQMLATKELDKNGGKQFIITEKYLLYFIKLNEELALRLHKCRGF